MLRVFVLIGGLLGGAAGSQFPEYAQQYTQRLGGAVDALEQVVSDFDASAQAEGMTREAALDEMRGTAFLDRRRSDMERTFGRYERLRTDLVALETAGPFMRAYHATRLTDAEVARAALEAYEPAVPLTMPGAVFTGAGFFAGVFAVWAALRVLLWPFARRRAPARGA